MPTTPKFKPGQTVKLLPFEDQPLQYAVVDEYEGNNLYCVTLEKKYWDKDERDGLREVDEDQIREDDRGRRRKK
jgi:hypothetical protein